MTDSSFHFASFSLIFVVVVVKISKLSKCAAAVKTSTHRTMCARHINCNVYWRFERTFKCSFERCINVQMCAAIRFNVVLPNAKCLGKHNQTTFVSISINGRINNTKYDIIDTEMSYATKKNNRNNAIKIHKNITFLKHQNIETSILILFTEFYRNRRETFGIKWFFSSSDSL